MLPNLFRNAPGELSQDAALCWLLELADPAVAAAHPELHQVGREFLALLFERSRRQVPPIRQIVVECQKAHVDILATLNTNELAILIENKAGTTEHSDQLTRYVAALCAEGWSREQVLPVYTQLGDQSDYSAVEMAGYAIVHRADVIQVLADGRSRGVRSDILDAYCEHLSSIERKVQAFRTASSGEPWSDEAWTGFFMALQAVLGGEWKYVPHPGYFWCFTWAEVTIGELVYWLQLSEARLCVKVGRADGVKLSTAELEPLREELLAAAGGLPLKRTRLTAGCASTIAALPSDYRVYSEAGRLDLEATLCVLKPVTQCLAAFAAQQRPAGAQPF